ncbi:MAG: PIN domain-containing protein [Ginsengibacter sp.]
MASKLFLDTNIIIDLLAERNYELDSIHEIIKLSEKGITDLYISESIIATVFYILRKEKKINTLLALRELCKIVNVISFSKDILYFPIENYIDKEDGLLYFLAAKAKMDYFITRNVEDIIFLFPSLQVISPNNFLKETNLNDLP